MIPPIVTEAKKNRSFPSSFHVIRAYMILSRSFEWIVQTGRRVSRAIVWCWSEARSEGPQENSHGQCSFSQRSRTDMYVQERYFWGEQKKSWVCVPKNEANAALDVHKYPDELVELPSMRRKLQITICRLWCRKKWLTRFSSGGVQQSRGTHW